jgi:uncharacterized membrane protein
MGELLLTIHILAAAAWIGGGLYATFSASTLAGSMGLKPVMLVEDSVSTKFFGASVALVLLSGIGLVITSDQFGWTNAFVLIGIAAIVLDGVIEGVIFSPRVKRLTEADEPSMTEFRSILRTSSVLHMAILFFTVWAMVAKLGS